MDAEGGRCRFPKSERLSLKLETDSLFANGNSFISYPLRIIYLAAETPEETPSPQKNGAVVLIGAPKKRLRKAVCRNRVKRLIREAYRINKQSINELYKERNKRLMIAFMYVGEGLPSYTSIEKSVKAAIKKLIDNDL